MLGKTMNTCTFKTPPIAFLNVLLSDYKNKNVFQSLPEEDLEVKIILN